MQRVTARRIALTRALVAAADVAPQVAPQAADLIAHLTSQVCACVRVCAWGVGECVRMRVDVFEGVRMCVCVDVRNLSSLFAIGCSSCANPTCTAVSSAGAGGGCQQHIV